MKAAVNIALWIVISLLILFTALAVLVGCVLLMPQWAVRIQVATCYVLVPFMTERTIHTLTIIFLALAALLLVCGILRFAIAVCEKCGGRRRAAGKGESVRATEPE